MQKKVYIGGLISEVERELLGVELLGVQKKVYIGGLISEVERELLGPGKGVRGVLSSGVCPYRGVLRYIVNKMA